MKAFRLVAGVLALSVLLSGSRSVASIVVEWADQGGSLVGTFSGSFDTTGYTLNSTSSFSSTFIAANPASEFSFFSHIGGSTQDLYELDGLSTGSDIFLISLLGGGGATGTSVGFETNNTGSDPTTRAFLP